MIPALSAVFSKLDGLTPFLAPLLPAPRDAQDPAPILVTGLVR
jgi:hypothetical protein